ncbi:MAG: hypothetical protein GY906_26035 [bacterium]|nr:hypothetical protein [bacterium]
MRYVFAALVVLICLGAATPVEAEVATSLGVQIDGSQEVDQYNHDYVSTGFSVGIEWLRPIHPGIRLGIGVEHLLRRQVANNESDFSIWAAFVSARWNPWSQRPWYLVGRLGYGFINRPQLNASGSGYSYSEETKGGVCAALGIGSDFGRHFAVELLYAQYHGKVESSGGGNVLDPPVFVDFGNTLSYRYQTLVIRGIYRF